MANGNKYEKTPKIMIFQKHNSKIPKLNFFIGKNAIEITKEYTFLGLKLEPNGKFKLTQQQLSEKALHVLHKIRKQLDISSLSPKIAIKIFNGITSPILLYNSEVWGAYQRNDYNKWDSSETEKNPPKVLQAISGSKQKGQQYSLQRRTRKISAFNLNTKKLNQLHETHPGTT